MKTSTIQTQKFSTLIGSGLLLLATLSATGCQMDVGGQTLPSPWWLTDDPQYYAPGSEFKLQREADALREQQANHISEPQP